MKLIESAIMKSGLGTTVQEEFEHFLPHDFSPLVPACSREDENFLYPLNTILAGKS